MGGSTSYTHQELALLCLYVSTLGMSLCLSLARSSTYEYSAAAANASAVAKCRRTCAILGDFAQLALRSHDMLGHARGGAIGLIGLSGHTIIWAQVLCCASQTSFSTQKEAASSSKVASSAKIMQHNIMRYASIATACHFLCSYHPNSAHSRRLVRCAHTPADVTACCSTAAAERCMRLGSVG